MITSTDNYETPIDTKGQEAYGVPIRVFSKDQIIDALEVAEEFHLKLTGPIDLACDEKAICWNNLEYTFLLFTMEKKSNPSH